MNKLIELAETDLDMACPMQTDPLDIVEKIDALLGIDPSSQTYGASEATALTSAQPDGVGL